ncbi:MAG: DUF3536 domain-containing protein, partial [Planctomycetota bacterium]
MTDKIEETIKLLTEEGRRKGFLTYAEMSKLMDDQFIPPDRMDQVFMGLEDAGIEVLDDEDSSSVDEISRGTPAANTKVAAPRGKRAKTTTRAKRAAATVRAPLPEKIDDPVRMYLTQMGEIPLLTRPQEIFLAKAIEITRKRFRKKCMGSGLCMVESIKTLDLVRAGSLAFDRTLKVNPNPKPDDDPKIVETLGKQFLAKRLPVNIETIKRLFDRLREDYEPLMDGRLGKAERSAQLAKVQNLRRKLVILIEECHLQIKKVRPYAELLEDHYREMRIVERKLEAAKRTEKSTSPVIKEFAERLARIVPPGAARPGLAHIAADGETYGHHRKFGEMALAYALDRLDGDPEITLTNYSEFLATHPPEAQVEIAAETSWSCAHGVERWRSDCSCGSESSSWRAPLRAALDWLRDRLGVLYEERAAKLLNDPWAARNAYIDVLLDGSA